MRGLFLSILAVMLAAGMSLTTSAQSRRVPQPTPTPADESVHIVTEEIKLNVLAYADDGKFVSDLKPADLVITDNNILNQAISVRRIPANVLIIMDTGGEMRQVKNVDQTRRTAKAVIDALNPEDSIALMQYSDRADILTEWTTDRQQLANSVGRLKFGRKSAFTEALRLARSFLTKLPLENKHLVLITDGTDSGDQSLKRDAIRQILSTDISVHIISYARMEATDITPRTKMISKSPPPKAMPDEVAAQLPNGVRDVARAPKIGPTINLDRTLIKKMKARKADLENSEIQMETLAANTNGEIIIPDSVDEMIEKAGLVSKMIDAGYVVTYIPKEPVTDTTGERNIEVTSKRVGLIVQSKRKLVIERTN
ncbi:MAG: VWA domain-containing protein [Acidobacteriota bacterium]